MFKASFLPELLPRGMSYSVMGVLSLGKSHAGNYVKRLWELGLTYLEWIHKTQLLPEMILRSFQDVA
jgi:hypothetical protein